MNMAEKMSVASVWRPVQADQARGIYGGLANSFYSLIKMPGQQDFGLLMTGWGFSSFDTTNPLPEPVSVQLLTSSQEGTLHENTKRYISDPVTNGSGSVVVTDFNKDGKADIFLAAHNESPFAPLSSTVYMSTSGDQFQRVVLPDSVAGHDASVVQLADGPAVLVTTYMGDPSPLYVYQDGQFVVKDFPTTFGNDPSKNVVLKGASSVVHSFDGSGNLQLVRGDITHYNGDWSAPVASNIEVFSYDSRSNSINETPLQVITPYLSTLPEFKNVMSLNGPGQTHAYALYMDDVNHDGFMDVLVGQSMWAVDREDWPSALQILQNDRTGRFVDKTSSLNSSMMLNTSALDFTPSLVDIDHSGIDTYLFAGVVSAHQPERQSNYVLLNDGTGKLYVGMHDEFRDLSRQVNEFVRSQFQADAGYYVEPYTEATHTVVKFIGIPQRDGAINFLAESVVSDMSDAANPQTVYVYTNVPVAYNPTFDFKDNITIADRNGSTLIRTWAGDDVIHDVKAADATSVNGGLGTDTLVYSTAYMDAKISRTAEGFTVARQAAVDTLVGIERLVFTDQTIELPSIIEGFQPLAVYRFFNTASGAHFYTASVLEAEHAITNFDTFNFEGMAFGRSTRTDATTVDVHRCFFNSASGVHFYTADAEEAAHVLNTFASFHYEGVAYQAHGEKIDETTALYRFFNTATGTHFYTADAAEMESVRNAFADTFNFEGVAYYVGIEGT